MEGRGVVKMVDNNDQGVEPPWRRAQSGAIWCKSPNVPNDISSQLKMENRFTKTIGNFSYVVRQNEDGSYIVFRNPPRDYRDASTRRPVYRVSEIQILPLEEANKLLASGSNQFELVGTDPIKVINQQFFVALGKKEKVG
jgi:hypothetical protein